MTIEYSVLELFKPWLLGFCNCDCGEILYPWDNQKRVRRFKKWHNFRNHGFVFNRNKTELDYWYLWIPSYFGSDKKGHIMEHVYFYQEYHKCCMLEWGDVHHIDGNTENNMIWNLQGVTHKQHMNIHNKGNQYSKKDMSGRICYICGSTNTYIDKDGYASWFFEEGLGYYCSACQRRKRYLNTGS